MEASGEEAGRFEEQNKAGPNANGHYERNTGEDGKLVAGENHYSPPYDNQETSKAQEEAPFAKSEAQEEAPFAKPSSSDHVEETTTSPTERVENPPSNQQVEKGEAEAPIPEQMEESYSPERMAKSASPELVHAKQETSPKTEEVVAVEAPEEKPASEPKKRGRPAHTYDELAEMSRSERKRHREKKRRSDVNKGLDELLTLIFKIDPQLKRAAEDRQKRHSQNSRSKSAEGSTDAMLSRVELINSTVATLERIHRENETRRALIAHLARGLLASGGGGGGPPPGAPPPSQPPPFLPTSHGGGRGGMDQHGISQDQLQSLFASLRASGWQPPPNQNDSFRPSSGGMPPRRSMDMGPNQSALQALLDGAPSYSAGMHSQPDPSSLMSAAAAASGRSDYPPSQQDALAMLLREQAAGQPQQRDGGGGSNGSYYQALLEELKAEQPSFGHFTRESARAAAPPPPDHRGMASPEYLLVQALMGEGRDANGGAPPRIVSDPGVMPHQRQHLQHRGRGGHIHPSYPHGPPPPRGRGMR